MTGHDAAPVGFPAEAYLALLRSAQELLATRERREALLADLGLAPEGQGPAQPDSPPQPPAPLPPGAVPKGWATSRSLVELGTAGGAPGQASAAQVANALVAELAAPERLGQAITLARRIARALPEAEAQATALVDTLQGLLRSRRVETVQAGATPDLGGYQRWRGFECAHEYALADRFFGREAELAELERWAAGDPPDIAVRSICALGGGGKSALAWHWLEGSLPQLRQRGYEGAFWCSFYEKNFSFETFLRRLLRFAGQVADEQLAQLSRQEVEAKLLETLEQRAFLVVVDGLERLMNGYAVTFERAVDPESVRGGKRASELTAYDRQLADLRDAAFLRRLARAMASRVLITSRLRPADLEAHGGEAPLPHVDFVELGGLAFGDLAELWRSIVPGQPVDAELEALFVRSGNHPLVVSILGRSVAAFGGDWQAWKEHPQHLHFRPAPALREDEVRAHLIGVCMADLGEMACDVLGVLATSGKPMAFDLVARILLRGSAEQGDERWASEEHVARELDGLVRLGLVGLAEKAAPPEYDVHPVVRGATWNLITGGGGERFLTHALSEFLATPDRSAPDEGLDLNAAARQISRFVQAGELDRAWELYFNRLFWPLTLRSENRALLDLFMLLLPDSNVLRLLPLESRAEQGNATEILGHLLMEAGDSSRSDELLRWTGAIRLQTADFVGFLNARRSRTWQTMYQGRLFETERALQEIRLDAMRWLAPEIVPLIDIWVGIVRAVRGRGAEARRLFALARATDLDLRWWTQGAAEGWVYLGRPDEALALLDQLPPWTSRDGTHQLAWENLTRGMALFQRREYDAAWDALLECRSLASRSDYKIIECFALPYIAEIQLECGEPGEAERSLARYADLDPDDGYRLSAADVWRVRARCRLAAGDRAAAFAHASRAYVLAACDGPPFTYAAALERARATLEACGGYVPTTRSQVDPRWRSIFGALAQEERELGEQLEEMRQAAGQGGAEASERRPMTDEEARRVLQQPPILEAASGLDRQWWHATTRGAPAAFKDAFLAALEAQQVSLTRFREVFEAGEHKSLEVVFHQLRAERIVSPAAPRPLRGLDEGARQLWLRAGDEHARALDTFMRTDFAQVVWSHFVLHQFGREGVSAFLHDNRRRLAYGDDATARAWWDQLEAVASPEAMLVLSQCVVLRGATLAQFVQEIATGSEHGIAYAFEALHVQRAIERLKVTQVSKTEGWSDIQLQLRLADIRRQIAVADAGEEARQLWRSLEAQHNPRQVLQLAEELALRGATLEHYLDAYVFSESENIQANLAHVDYALLRKSPWDPAGPWPRVAAVHSRTARFTDISSWPEERVRHRLAAMLERVGLAQASDDAQTWWRALAGRLPPAALLRVVEELDMRDASVGELYRATVDGDTESIPAAIAFLEVSRIREGEKYQARQRASALNREGNRHYGQGDLAAAIEAYAAAIGQAPDEPVFYTNLANAWLARDDLDLAVRLAEAEAALERGLEKCPGAATIEKELRSVGARSRLLALGGLSQEGQAAQMLPVVTPIALEVALDLTPLFEEGEAEGMRAITSMRGRIAEATGVGVPGVRVRGNEGDLAPGTYIIILDEVPLVMGSVNQGHVFTKAPDTLLGTLGVDYVAVRDPVDGGEGAWVAAERAEELPEPRWAAGEYIARHLEAVLLRNLAQFAGHVEVRERLTQSWSADARTILNNSALLTAFTRALQALLWEGVPTVDLEPLCAGFLAQRSGAASLDQTVADLRMLPGIRPRLPGAAPGTALLRLGPRLERALAERLLEYGDIHILALEPEPTQEALAAVRDGYDPAHPTALVCEDPTLRPYVRRLVELEFPDLHVLAAAELDPERLAAVEGEIELEGEG